MRNAKRWLWAVPVIALPLMAAACSVEIGATTTTADAVVDFDGAEVIRVIDGDSVELRIEGEVFESRLEGVNAPELFGSDNKRTCNGSKALEALEAVLDGGDVEAEFDGSDRFGRLLVELSVDGVSVSDTLINQGWLLVTANNKNRRESLKIAADSEKGMFGPECGLPSHDLSISAIQADPAGNDRFNLTEEWVELQNKSDEVGELRGWTLRDETTGHRFELPAQSLPPGEKIKVRTGSGTDSGEDVYLGESFPVWSNGDETVLLIDPKGVVAEVIFLLGVGE